MVRVIIFRRMRQNQRRLKLRKMSISFRRARGSLSACRREVASEQFLRRAAHRDSHFLEANCGEVRDALSRLTLIALADDADADGRAVVLARAGCRRRAIRRRPDGRPRLAREHWRS